MWFRFNVYFCMQVFAKVVRKPSGKQVGVVDLYFDPAGNEHVCDLLIKKGLFLSSERPVFETPPSTPPIQAVTPIQTNTKLSQLASLIKKSVEKKCLSQDLKKTMKDSDLQPPVLSIKNGERSTIKMSYKEDEVAARCEYSDMPPLERCPVSEDDWWTDESDDSSLNDLRRLSSRSHVTNSCGSRTGHVTDDDDW